MIGDSMKNRKGYMLVELILASLIAFGVTTFLVTMTLKLKNKNDDLLVESLVTTDTSVATNSLLKIINENPNDFDCGLVKVNKDKNTIMYDNKVVAVFGEYAQLRESLSYCKDQEMDGSAQIHIGVDVPQLPNKDFDINIDYIKRKNPSPNVIFEALGNYGFAIAGSNNASRGNNIDDAWTANNWVYAPPSNSKYKNILNELKNKYNISGLNNISGSRLNTNGGVVTKAIFGYFAYGSSGGGSAYDGKILLIRPDFSYAFIPYENKGWGWSEFLDITDYIDRRHPDGWYYVSFIGASRAPQLAWSMTAVYEGGDAPYSYTKLVLDERTLANSSVDIMFKNKYKLMGTYRLTGTILAGGVSAWPDKVSTTGDRVFAILNDNSTKQLYETVYKGKKLFAGRSSTDFACNIFNTERNNNIRGGELDIFNETLDSQFFGGKELTGIRMIKDGSNGIKVGLVGVSMAIEQQ